MSLPFNEEDLIKGLTPETAHSDELAAVAASEFNALQVGEIILIEQNFTKSPLSALP